MKGFRSPIVKRIQIGKGYSPKKGYEDVVWKCKKCGAFVGVHEVVGERYIPPYCPHCHTKDKHIFIWTKSYRADAAGKIID
jgi:Zn finger protein HypA/HybF involved in hydrogenase expression